MRRVSEPQFHHLHDGRHALLSSCCEVRVMGELHTAHSESKKVVPTLIIRNCGQKRVLCATGSGKEIRLSEGDYEIMSMVEGGG